MAVLAISLLEWETSNFWWPCLWSSSVLVSMTLTRNKIIGNHFGFFVSWLSLFCERKSTASATDNILVWSCFRQNYICRKQKRVLKELIFRMQNDSVTVSDVRRLYSIDIIIMISFDLCCQGNSSLTLVQNIYGDKSDDFHSSRNAAVHVSVCDEKKINKWMDARTQCLVFNPLLCDVCACVCV